MASACKFFDEDAVYRINKKKFVDVGLVLENSEFISSDEEQSDDPDYHGWERMKKGHVRVAWYPNGAEEVLPERRVKLCDRSLMPGDVVRKIIKGKDTQLGYCRYTDVKVDVQVIGTQKVVIGVSSKDLIPLEEFMSDVAVFKDSWVGMVKNVKTELILKDSDGSRCLMSDVDAFDMDDVLDRRERESEFKKYSFYPGQQLWGPTYCFQKVKWLNVTKPMSDENPREMKVCPSKSVRCTVEDVKVVSANIQWVCKAYSKESVRNQSVEQPSSQVSGEDLKSIKVMNIFEPCTLQIGDRNFLIMKEDFDVLTMEEWKNRMSSRLHSDAQNSPFHKKKSLNKANLETKENCIDVTATNGNEAEDAYDDSEFEDIDDNESGKSSDTASVTSHSTASSVENTSGMHKKSKKGPNYTTKFMKKKKSVRRRALRHVMKETLPLKPGEKLVTEALITETKAHVVWQDGTVEHNILSTHLYPVHHLDSHEFFPGDYVIDSKESRPYEYGVVKQVDHTGRTASITWMKTYHAGGDPHPEVLSEEEVSVYDIKDHPDFKYRPGSCVIRVVNSEDSNPGAGQVVDVHSTGKVEVSWVSGETSLCYPQELYRVGEYDSDDLWADDDSFSDEDSWETESEKSILGSDDEAGEKELDDTAKDLEKVSIKLEEKDLDEKSTEDMQEKLLANIEKLRAGMARLEEVFTQNPTLQTCNVMRRLLELYKHCKVLDQLLGTTYFHERHLQSLVERLKHRGRVNSLQHIADQIYRLFLSNDSNFETNDSQGQAQAQSKDELNAGTQDKDTDSSKIEIDILIDSPVGDAPVLTNNTANFGEDMCGRKPLLSPVSPTSGSEPRNLCQQLCAILKSRLLKAHEDAEMRFGMSRSETSALLAAEIESLSNVSTEGKGDVPQVDAKESEKLKDEASSGVESMEEECSQINNVGQGTFSIIESVPDRHIYKLSIFQPTEPSAFFRIVKKEMNILKSSLPEGIVVKSFEDRIDLYSVLIKGPKRTPYEDGLFFFDFQFPADYPKVPPLCHYISYCSDRLNPNLYEGGKVCVSLLGTWGGKGTEMWNPETSNLLQVIVSIQGLILVAEPYYNEAGYERQKGTQQGRENSRMYNEMVVLKLVQAMTKLILNPPEIFKQEIVYHFQQQASKLIQRLENWLTMSESWNSEHPASPASPSTFKELHNCDTSAQDTMLPEFPLIPASKGFCLTLRKSLADFKEVILSSSSSVLQC